MSEMLNIWRSAPKGEQLTKAMVDDMRKSQNPDPKSAIIDPLNSMHLGGVRGKPTQIPFNTLRRMAKVPAISAIINTRLNQVARFARRPRFDGDMGFRVGLKDKNRKMTDKERERAHEIEEFILRTGWEKNKIRKDNFNRFLRKTVRDSLELDAMAFENVENMKGDLAELWAMDATTIEMVINNPMGDVDYDMPVYVPETKRGQKIAGDVAYVQKVNGTVVAEYTEDELSYAIRNPRTDLEVADFGMSELEQLMEIVTGIINGVHYNTSYFSESSLPQGVLEVVGKYKEEHLQGFKKHWQNMTQGPGGKWKVPVMALEEGQGFKFTPFKNSNKDMEFNEFLEFLFNIACAVYQIDPNEVGFKSWTSGGNNAMGQSDNTEAKQDHSKDKGFIPLMNFLSDNMNSNVIDRIDDSFAFEWVGVDEEDEEKKLERQQKQIDMGRKTVNEIRKENDEEEIDEDWANAPANAQLIQVYMADKQHDQQKEMGEDQQQQQAQDQQQQQASEEEGHKRELEKLDKQHEQTMEQKQAEQEHQKEVEQMKQQHEQQIKEKEAKQKPKSDIKKSLTEDEGVDVSIEWTDY